MTVRDSHTTDFSNSQVFFADFVALNYRNSKSPMQFLDEIDNFMYKPASDVKPIIDRYEAIMNGAPQTSDDFCLAKKLGKAYYEYLKKVSDNAQEFWKDVMYYVFTINAKLPFPDRHVCGF